MTRSCGSIVPLPQPIQAAYEGALDVVCPSCAAAVGAYCTAPDGRLRRCPCVTRCRAIPADLGSPDPETPADAAGTRSAPKTAPLQLDYDDITEPRHQRGDE